MTTQLYRYEGPELRVTKKNETILIYAAFCLDINIQFKTYTLIFPFNIRGPKDPFIVSGLRE